MKYIMQKHKGIIVAYALLILSLLLFYSCSKDCNYTVEEFTHLKGSDIYLLVRTFETHEVPENYENENIEHIFIKSSQCE